MNTIVIASLTLGLAGSMHCAGMCGPLVMIIHGNSSSRNRAWWWNKVIYHFGRLLVYAAFGLIAGFIGKGIASAGFQQWLSVIAGISLLVIIIWPYMPFKKISWGQPVFLYVNKTFSTFLQSKNKSKYFFLGVINGFLPCGLVYGAMAASISAGSPFGSMLFMILFGVATVPVLITIAGFSGAIQKRFKAKSLGYLRVGLSVLAILFILRGANLGIPYLSPRVAAETCEVDCCQRK